MGIRMIHVVVVGSKRSWVLEPAVVVMRVDGLGGKLTDSTKQ